MIDTETRTPESELQMLTDLVACDGWQVLQEHLETAWGDSACLAAIDQAVATAAPADELAITKRIRDTFKGVRAEARWVEQRMAQLEVAVKERKKPATVDRFAPWRRVPRKSSIGEGVW